MRQAREAVEVFHKSGIAHLNLELSSFMIEMTENSNCPRVFLNDFLLAVLSTERIREDEVRRKQAITEDQKALKEIEKLLNQNVEETVIEPAENLESPIQILERRLVIAEEGFLPFAGFIGSIVNATIGAVILLVIVGFIRR